MTGDPINLYPRRSERRSGLSSDSFLTLTQGARIPKLGLGTWKISDEAAPGVIRDALEIGYRHLDCACDYGNEVAVGAGITRALSDGICSREELWVTSKLWNTYHHPDHVRPAVTRSLHDLGLDYLDLYLIHFPISLAFVPFDERYPPAWFFDPNAERPHLVPVPIPIADTWRAMESLVTEGLVKQIGVCNFSTSLIRDLIAGATIKPEVLQVEMHPSLTQEKLLRYCHQEQIVCTAFSPLGAGSYVPLDMASEADSILVHPVVTDIAANHGRTTAQIVLRWGVQRGTAVIPKSQSREHLIENAAIFDFSLTEDEMSAINGLNASRRFNDPGEFCEQAFNTFFPIFD